MAYLKLVFKIRNRFLRTYVRIRSLPEFSANISQQWQRLRDFKLRIVRFDRSRNTGVACDPRRTGISVVRKIEAKINGSGPGVRK